MNKKIDKPNIILLVGDCLRAENVSKSTMPFLKDKNKIEFKACYSPSTWTLPSYASLYTMSSPIEHNITRPGDKLKKEFAILPFILKESNYETSAFSENPFFLGK
jgi:arylsulfatase A-like enzyme